MAEIKIQGYKCNRCNHEWSPRVNKRIYDSKDCLPAICPKCKSAHWNHVEEKH